MADRGALADRAPQRAAAPVSLPTPGPGRRARGRIERHLLARARTAVAAGTVITLAVSRAACGGKSLEEKGGGKGGGKGELLIGSAGFTESKVLAEIYSRVLADAGYRTRVQTLANRELYEPALEKGQIDVVPEYASTLAEFLNAKKNGSKAKPVATSDIDKTVTALEKLASPRGLKVLLGGPGDGPERVRGQQGISRREQAEDPLRPRRIEAEDQTRLG